MLMFGIVFFLYFLKLSTGKENKSTALKIMSQYSKTSTRFVCRPEDGFSDDSDKSLFTVHLLNAKRKFQKQRGFFLCYKSKHFITVL